MKTKEQALRDLGRVVAEEAEIISKLTVREAAERIWYPGGPSMDELMERCAASGLCKPEAAPRHRIRDAFVQEIGEDHPNALSRLDILDGVGSRR